MKFSSLRQEIEEARKHFKLLKEEFYEVDKNKWESILSNLQNQFINYPHSFHWSWVNFKEESFGLGNLPVKPFYFLDKLVPKEESVWFIAEEDYYKSKFWLYEGKINAIQKIIENTYGYEYYIASKKNKWLLCENHHEVLIGTGGYIINKLKNLMRDISE